MTALPNPDYMAISPFKELAARADDVARVTSLQVFMKPFHARLRELSTAPRPNPDVRIGAGDDLLRRLQDDGFAPTTIDPEAKARLQVLTAPFAQALAACVEEQTQLGFKSCQLMLDSQAKEEIFRCIDGILANANVYSVASAYAGKPLTLTRIGLQVNTDALTRTRYGVVDDLGIPEHATSYMHIDSGGWPWIKVLIYLTEVSSMEHGPMRYVPGSHRLADDFELAVRKTNRKLAIPKSLFMALPEPFRLDANFGDYLDSTSDDVVAVLEQERPICDGVSDLILFNYNGMHRGGFVRQEQRFVLQCSLGWTELEAARQLIEAGAVTKQRPPEAPDVRPSGVSGGLNLKLLTNWFSLGGA